MIKVDFSLFLKTHWFVPILVVQWKNNKDYVAVWPYYRNEYIILISYKDCIHLKIIQLNLNLMNTCSPLTFIGFSLISLNPQTTFGRFHYIYKGINHTLSLGLHQQFTPTTSSGINLVNPQFSKFHKNLSHYKLRQHEWLWLFHPLQSFK